MATVTITGTLSDFGLRDLSKFQPRIVFRPTGPAFKGSMALATREVVAVPNSSGDFAAQLEPSNGTRPARTFDVRFEWLDAGGNSNFIDLIEGFTVPPEGGPIGDLAAVDYLPTDVYVSETAPLNPAMSLWWLNPVTGDLFERK